ncbi:MAG: hypothetical protein ACOC10_03625 [Bacteroidota bacterium]
MNTFNFPYYIRSNSALNEFTLKQLSQLIRHYPYFQMARMLYLKNLYVLHKEEFEAELKKNVLFITDRKKLYELLFDQSFPSGETGGNHNSADEGKGGSAVTSLHTAETEASVSAPAEIFENGQDDASIPEQPPKLSNAVRRIFTESMRDNISGLLDFQQNDANKEVPEDELRLNTIQYDVEKEYGDQLEVIDHNPVSIEFEIAQDNNNAEPKEVDLIRISNSISSARGLLNLEYRLKNTEPAEDKKTGEKEPEIETELLELDARVADMEKGKKEQISENTYEEKDSGKSFTEWLDEINRNNEKTQKAFGPEENNKEELVYGQPTARREKSKNSLIDRFIQLNPTIKPMAKLQHEQYDVSTESVEENEDYLTDTLAKIYVKQERYHKTISVYKKLILKYPEKNTYFANQINEIEKKLNN